MVSRAGETRAGCLAGRGVTGRVAVEDEGLALALPGTAQVGNRGL
jgi:hypothetical protein